jgi:MFS family permease
MFKKLGWGALFGDGNGKQLGALCFAIWLHAANSMLAATTLPRAVDEIGGAALIGWAFMLYQIGSILAGAATGLLFSRFGFRNAMIGGATVYAFGCVVAGLAPTIEMLLAGRALQGIGGGALVALTFVAVQRLFPPAVMPRVVALISSVWSVSAFCGPLVGGTFATYGDWRMAFWVFAVQAGIFIIAARVLFIHELAGPQLEPKPIPFARLGVLGFAVGLIALAGVDPTPVASSAMCVGAVVALALFFKMDAARPEVRMFPSNPLDIRTPVGAGMVLFMAGFCGTMSFLVYGPLFLEHLHGITPLGAGYIVATESVAWGVASVATASASLRAEKWIIRCGPLVIALGTAGFMLFMPAGPIVGVLASAVCQGVGFGMMMGFVVRRIVASASVQERDVAASAMPTIQQIGMAVGASAVGIVANTNGVATDMTKAVAENAAVWVFAAFLPLFFIAWIGAVRLTQPDVSNGVDA